MARLHKEMPPRPSTATHREALLEDALAILEDEYAEPLQLEDIAARIATSRRQLQRVFAEVYGVPYRTVLCRIRMRRAAELLAGGDVRSIRAIARSVGYHQPAQFAKAFAREHGVPPSVYRAHARASRPDPPPALAPAPPQRLRPSLVRAPDPVAAPSPRPIDGRAEGFWNDD